MAGRPTKLTPEVQRRIVDAISAGNYYEAAARYAGVHPESIINWMHRGSTAKAGIYFEFFEAVTRAEAEAEVRIVAQWQQQVPQDWRAARDFLARRYPQRWGPTDKHELSGPGGSPVQVATMHGDDAIAVARLLRDVGALADLDDADADTGDG